MGSFSPQRKTVLYVDLEGKSKVLWQYEGPGGITAGLPSPDGRYLAIPVTVRNTNVWTLEGF